MRIFFVALMMVGCAPAVDGLIPAGEWGGVGFRLTVEDDGMGTLLGDCAHGNLIAPLDADNGDVSVPVAWRTDGGNIDPDNPPPPVPTTLEATVRGERLKGRLTFDEIDGLYETVDVRLHEPAELVPCL